MCPGTIMWPGLLFGHIPYIYPLFSRPWIFFQPPNKPRACGYSPPPDPSPIRLVKDPNQTDVDPITIFISKNHTDFRARLTNDTETVGPMRSFTQRHRYRTTIDLPQEIHNKATIMWNNVFAIVLERRCLIEGPQKKKERKTMNTSHILLWRIFVNVILKGALHLLSCYCFPQFTLPWKL